MREDYTGVIGILLQPGPPKRYGLIHNQQTGNITFPAGGRESGESSDIVTLRREMQEETGLLEGQYKVIFTGKKHEFVYGPKKKERAGQKAIQPVFLVETTMNDLNPEDPDSKFHGWFTAEETLKELTFEDSKEIFRKILDL